jgi:hypothetical protein
MTPARVRSRLSAVAVTLAVGVTTTPPLAAQDPGPRPVVGGHRVIWNPFTRSPLPSTHVRSLTGAGQLTGVEYVPEFDLGGVVVPAVQGNLLFAELEFEYMHRVQPWLGVWVNAGALARLGTDAGTLLSQGVTTITGFELGWLFRVYESESFVVSGTAALTESGITEVDLAGWARGVIEGEREPLVSSNPRLQGRGGLRLAWGFNPTWGAQLESDFGFEESSAPDAADEWIWDQAGSVSLDLAPERGIPVGFVLSGASRESPREGGDPDVRTWEASLRSAFTGSDNYLIALDTGWSTFDLPDGDEIGLIRLGLTLMLYF